MRPINQSENYVKNVTMVFDHLFLVVDEIFIVKKNAKELIKTYKLIIITKKFNFYFLVFVSFSEENVSDVESFNFHSYFFEKKMCRR